MKTSYTLSTLDPRLQRPNKEVAAFALLVSQASGKQIIEEFIGHPLGTTVDVVHNTENDDPPDLEAFGVGIEITDFPPDQVPLKKVGDKHNRALIVPPFHETKGKFSKIESQSLALNFTTPPFFALSEEVAALKAYAVDMLKAKDVVTNQVLLIDQRAMLWKDSPDAALANAVNETTLRNIQLIVAVRSDESVRFYRRS